MAVLAGLMEFVGQLKSQHGILQRPNLSMSLRILDLAWPFRDDYWEVSLRKTHVVLVSRLSKDNPFDTNGSKMRWRRII